MGADWEGRAPAREKKRPLASFCGKSRMGHSALRRSLLTVPGGTLKWIFPEPSRAWQILRAPGWQSPFHARGLENRSFVRFLAPRAFLGRACHGSEKALGSSWRRRLLVLEPVSGFEPETCGLRNRCSTTELHWLFRLEGGQIT